MADDLLQDFRKGKHVMRHCQGIWNAIWSDMFTESTFVRYRHQTGGLTWLTLNPSCVTRRAPRSYCQLQGGLLAAKDKQNKKTTTTHNEGAPGRITTDASDRQKIKEALHNKYYIDPLAIPTHPRGLWNVVTVLRATDNVNADEYIKTGREQMA